MTTTIDEALPGLDAPATAPAKPARRPSVVKEVRFKRTEGEPLVRAVALALGIMRHMRATSWAEIAAAEDEDRRFGAPFEDYRRLMAAIALDEEQVLLLERYASFLPFLRLNPTVTIAVCPACFKVVEADRGTSPSTEPADSEKAGPDSPGPAETDEASVAETKPLSPVQVHGWSVVARQPPTKCRLTPGCDAKPVKVAPAPKATPPPKATAPTEPVTTEPAAPVTPAEPPEGTPVEASPVFCLLCTPCQAARDGEETDEACQSTFGGDCALSPRDCSCTGCAAPQQTSANALAPQAEPVAQQVAHEATQPASEPVEPAVPATPAQAPATARPATCGLCPTCRADRDGEDVTAPCYADFGDGACALSPQACGCTSCSP